jgi:DNA-directed RNA polymerase alpha subunit
MTKMENLNHEGLIKKEKRRLRFKKVAEKRTNEIVNKIKILGNTSNRSTYDYKKEEINKIFDYIHKSLDKQKNYFTFSKKSKNEFKL